MPILDIEVFRHSEVQLLAVSEGQSVLFHQPESCFERLEDVAGRVKIIDGFLTNPSFSR